MNPHLLKKNILKQKMVVSYLIWYGLVSQATKRHRQSHNLHIVGKAKNGNF